AIDAGQRDVVTVATVRISQVHASGRGARYHVTTGEDAAGAADAVFAGIQLIRLAGIGTVGSADRILLVIAGAEHHPALVADHAEGGIEALGIGVATRG